MRSIEHTWLCAISHIFHTNGSDVKLVSDFTAKIPFIDMLQSRRMQFLDGLRHLNNAVVQLMTFVRYSKSPCSVVLFVVFFTVLFVYSVFCLSVAVTR